MKLELDIEKVNLALAAKAMNTADLARKSGYSLNTIRQYMTLKREPNTKSIGRIAQALEVDVIAILKE